MNNIQLDGDINYNINNLICQLNIDYYETLSIYLLKSNGDNSWLLKYIDNLNKNKNKNININTNTNTNNESEVLNDDTLYKKSWNKLNVIHKIIKIKEFVNNIKLDNELDKTNLKNKLIELIHNKNLTKKEKVKYDQINGKIISLIDLQYIDGKYII
jgi:hypothetical protein